MKRQNIATALALVGILLAAAAVVTLLVVTADREPAILGGVSDPDETVELFFDSMCAGELETCDGMVYGYSSLGLDSEPESEIGALLLDALADSYAWEPSGDCVVDGISAEGAVMFTYLDTAAMTESVRETAGENLERFAAEAASNDSLYNEDGSYREDVIMQLLRQAVEAELEDAERYYVSQELAISLSYTGGEWKIVLDSELIAAITGNLVLQREGA